MEWLRRKTFQLLKPWYRRQAWTRYQRYQGLVTFWQQMYCPKTAEDMQTQADRYRAQYEKLR